MTAFAIGKDDEVTYKLSPSTGEVDMYIRHEDGEQLVIRFLESEAIDLFKEALERMQFSFKMERVSPAKGKAGAVKNEQHV